ncbi:hypothetical protein ACOMHN_012271 [Nucella lapillus]
MKMCRLDSVCVTAIGSINGHCCYDNTSRGVDEMMAASPLLSSFLSPCPRKPPLAPPSQAGSAGFHKGGYVNRYKLQQQRIRTLNQLENSSEAKKKVHRSLPKINNGPEKENLVIRAVKRSNTLGVIKLPGVKAPTNHPAVPPPPAPNRKSLPVKTYYLRTNPEHTSFISKSLPSLPSIQGSPSYTEHRRQIPLTDRPPPHHADRLKLPGFPAKHRFQSIVSQKHLHRDPTDLLKSAQADQDSNPKTNSRLPPTLKALPTDRGPRLPADPHAQEKPHTSGSLRIRYSKAPSEGVISETQSEPSFEVSRKWKEDCQCLRCQMLKRQFREGDSHYTLWGRYPCHNVDPSVMLDD